MELPVFLSILIPVYNWDIGQLLDCLVNQCNQLPIGYKVEIIVLDDGSTKKYTNRSNAAKFASVTYRELNHNRGRATVRNELIQQAQGRYLLFLDADMLPDSDEFIEKYLEQGRHGAAIVCGGISYLQNKRNDPEYSFYLYKSNRTEALPAVIRGKTPWRYLFSSNIMVRSDIMQSCRFDPRFCGYGFEDIHWGIRLGYLYAITHIDNTCSHMGVMKKQEVYAKMRDSMQNYALLISLYPEKTARNGAARIAGYLQHLPRMMLVWGDIMLSRLFFWLSWNPLVYLLFQCHKAVILAIILKRNSNA